jgi:hypothetical protein
VRERAVRWIIFGAMVVAFPAVYFLFVIAGLLPLAYVAWLAYLDPGLWIANAIHLVVWGALFYGVAWLAGKGLARLPRWAGYTTLALILAALGWVALQPIYGLGHSEYAGVSVYRLFVKPEQQAPAVITPSVARPMAAPGGAAEKAARPAR